MIECLFQSYHHTNAIFTKKTNKDICKHENEFGSGVEVVSKTCLGFVFAFVVDFVVESVVGAVVEVVRGPGVADGSGLGRSSMGLLGRTEPMEI